MSCRLVTITHAPRTPRDTTWITTDGILDPGQYFDTTWGPGGGWRGALNGEVCDGHISTGRQADSQTDSRTDSQIYRQTARQTDRHNIMNPRLNANSNSHLFLYLLAAWLLLLVNQRSITSIQFWINDLPSFVSGLLSHSTDIRHRNFWFWLFPSK